MLFFIYCGLWDLLGYYTLEWVRVLEYIFRISRYQIYLVRAIYLYTSEFLNVFRRISRRRSSFEFVIIAYYCSIKYSCFTLEILSPSLLWNVTGVCYCFWVTQKIALWRLWKLSATNDETILEKYYTDWCQPVVFFHNQNEDRRN